MHGLLRQSAKERSATRPNFDAGGRGLAPTADPGRRILYDGDVGYAGRSGAHDPKVVVGVDVDGDGLDDYWFGGVDANRDGIPDALQQPGVLVQMPSPSLAGAPTV